MNVNTKQKQYLNHFHTKMSIRILFFVSITVEDPRIPLPTRGNTTPAEITTMVIVVHQSYQESMGQ